MRVYESIHLVKGEDLNHHGTLFAARASEWFVEAGFAAAACENGNTDEIVLRNVHRMSFQKPVSKGTVLAFHSRVACLGRSSIMVSIEASDAITGWTYIEGFITFVTIDAATRMKKEHNLLLDAPQDEREIRIREEALKQRLQS